MPLVSALAASHAPNILLEPGREWEDFMDLHYSMAPQGSANRPTLEQQKKLRRDAEAAFAVLRDDLERAKPDVLIVVANDQFVNFFWNNIPTFFVTVADEVKGQFTRHSFHYRNHKELGKNIVRAGMEKGIDFSYGEHVELQHTQNVPLYFLLPNLSNYSLITAAAHGYVPDARAAVVSVVYAFLYIAVLLAAATLIFNRRNFK